VNPTSISKPMRPHQPDYVLALIIFVLMALGLIMIYSISPVLSQKMFGNTDRNYFFYSQLANIGVGLVGWIAASSIDYERWKRWVPALMVLAVACLAVLLVPSLTFSKNGATRWIKLGSFTFQPAELLKLAYVLYLASWLEKRAGDLRSFAAGIVPFGLTLLAVSFVVVVLQRDMGTMLVLALSAIGMLYVAGARLDHVAALVAAGVAAGWLAIVTFPHRVARLATFLDPGKDPNGQGYHINQALIAIGSGGLMGLGIGRSIQVYGYLPEAANDSIFAIIAEEFGLVGSLVILALFAVLVWRGLKIARSAPDTFGRLTATGISLWLLFQAMINIAAMLSLVPLTGIPLPFISYGGSSLVISLIGAGILINISKYTIREVPGDAHNRERGRNGWAYLADSRHGRRVKVAR
jgi:cell division protein FtsW